MPAYYKVRVFAERDLSKIKAKQGIFGSDWKFEIECVCYQHFITLPIVKMWKVMGFTNRNCCVSKGEILRDGHTMRCITRLNVHEPGFAERLKAVIAEEDQQRRSRFPFNINLASEKGE